MSVLAQVYVYTLTLQEKALAIDKANTSVCINNMNIQAVLMNVKVMIDQTSVSLEISFSSYKMLPTL